MKADVTSCTQEGESGELQYGQPHCNYWEDEAKKTVPEAVSKHIKDKKVMRNSQHQFMKEKLCCQPDSHLFVEG